MTAASCSATHKTYRFSDKKRTLMAYESPIQYFTCHGRQRVQTLCMWHAILFAYYLSVRLVHPLGSVRAIIPSDFSECVRFIYLFIFYATWALSVFLVALLIGFLAMHSTILCVTGGSIIPFIRNSPYSRLRIHNVNESGRNTPARRRALFLSNVICNDTLLFGLVLGHSYNSYVRT